MSENRKDGRKSGAAAACLAGAALISIFLPALVLFTGDGFLTEYIRLPESGRMLAELGILGLLLAGVSFGIRSGRRKLAGMALLAGIFCWLHQVFLPMVVSALYLGCLLLLGDFLREWIFGSRKTRKIREREEGAQEEDGFLLLFWDFILGSSAAILFYCLLSAAGAGRISFMRIGIYGAGALTALIRRRRILTGGRELAARAARVLEDGNRGVRMAVLWILLLFLLQAGRMNIALDFDTLWYGVRSEYIVAGGSGLYENPGLVGMVYVYSKGWEVLTLPLCDLASHSYLLFFNLWLAALGTSAMVWNAGLLGGSRILAAVLTVSVPGIMNMAVSAKTDIITWLLQLIMMGCFFTFVSGKRNAVLCLCGAAGAYGLSLTMKPTSLVFSTAVFGMMVLFLIWMAWRGGVRRSGAMPGKGQVWRGMAALLFPAGALMGIWARTMLITGMPVTSVFTSIFARLGFEMKYPFATSSLPQNYQEEPLAAVLLRRLFQMLLAPSGEDMSHVILAWGSSLLFFLLVFLLICHVCRRSGFKLQTGMAKEEKAEMAGPGREKTGAGTVVLAARVIFWPFLAVNLVSLVMLYQVDGNYFMLLYSMLILAACRAFEINRGTVCSRWFAGGLLPLLLFNGIVTAQTNWAWAAGFSEIRLTGTGRVNHRAMEQERFFGSGNGLIWQKLSEDRENRVIAFGNHPFCLQFPCIVESYKDITAPWGNVELVNSPEAFEAYMEYAGTDYVYAEAGYIGPGSWEWSYGLLRELIGRGTLTDLFFENGNALARVAKEPVPEQEARENLREFDEQYEVFP